MTKNWPSLVVKPGALFPLGITLVRMLVGADPVQPPASSLRAENNVVNELPDKVNGDDFLEAALAVWEWEGGAVRQESSPPGQTRYTRNDTKSEKHLRMFTS